jgi:1-acyl-sn-glycerol-3-phosphate acyltransferase
MAKLFLRIYEYFEGRRWLFMCLFFLFTAALLFFASKVQLQQNFMHMLPQDKKMDAFSKFFENSKFSDRIMVCITPKDSLSPTAPDDAVTFSDVFAENMKKDLAPFINELEYTANDSNITELLQLIDNNLPLFLSEDDYKVLDTLTTQKGIREKMKSNYQTLTGFSGIALKKFIAKDPLGLNYMGYNKLKSFQGDDKVGLYDQHFMSADKRHLLLFIHPRYPSSDTHHNQTFFLKMDELIQKTNVKDPRFGIAYFGAPAVAAGNANQINSDTLLTVSITLILLILIVSIFFKRLDASLLMLVPVIFGALFAMAVIYFLKGSISIISLAAGSLVLGIAVNYSLHFLTHYRYHPNVRDVLKELAFPMTIGSATTIGGFLCLQFVKAPVLRDLGLFAALSLIGAAVATLVILPHLVGRKKDPVPAEDPIHSWYQNLLEKLQTNRYLVGLFLLLTPVFFYFATGVQFENDMNKINYMSPQLKASEQLFNRISSYYQKSVFVLSKGKTLDEALSKNEQILPVLNHMKASGKIKNFTSVSNLLLSEAEQKARLDRWNHFWSDKKREKVKDFLYKEGLLVGFKESAFLPFEMQTNRAYTLLSAKDESLLKKAFLNNFIEEKDGVYSVIGLIKTSPAHVKEIYASLENVQGVTIFDRQYVMDNLVRLVSEDFNFIALFSSLLVLLALFLTYGRIELALITFIPMVISWIWILGIMALLGIKFNIINIILSTLVFALGDDYCIFTMDGLQQEYARGVKNLKSVTTSILLSVVTTIIGLGVLILAGHPALKSIGLVSIIGILCVWLMSQTLQPVLFNLLIQNPTRKRLAPYTFWKVLKSTFAFVYFILGSFLLVLIGLILTQILPDKKGKLKYVYHWILRLFAVSIMKIMVNVKKKIINEDHENFKQPAVIISNHQSFLDILVLVQLYPKLILLTNDWVWHSPIFGFVVRMADYVRAEEAEGALDRLAQKVKEGYSIVVFPEGTRSADSVIKRFHKGAFLLAEKLNIDILPIIIHGSGYCMEKGNYLLKDGHLTLKFLPRIKPNDTHLGVTYSERAKLIGRYFKLEFQVLRQEMETTTFYKEQLISNYLFKGPVLEWYMKVKLRLENNYAQFDKLIPKKGNILDVGCGYGFLSNMLGFVSAERTIIGLDYDEEKISIAQHGYMKGNNVAFVQANALEYFYPENYNDAIVISDVLHYLQPAEQVQLIEQSIKSLTDAGVLILRDGMKEQVKAHRGTRLTEWFSTKILGFNKTSGTGLSFLSSDLIYKMAEKYKLQLSVLEKGKYTSNVIFVLKKQA